MSKADHITLAILHFNRFDLTKECVESCLACSYREKDILILDNGSTDDSLLQLKREFRAQKNISIAHISPNLGFTGGFNAAVQKSQGPLVLMISNDVTLEKNALQPIINEMNNSDVYITQPAILQYFNPDLVDNLGGNYTWYGIGKGIGNDTVWNNKNTSKSITVDYCAATVMCVRKEWFIQSGGYDESFWSHYEDVDLALRAKMQGGYCTVVLNSLAYHKISQTYASHVPSATTIYHIRKNRIRVVQKHFHSLEKLMRLTVVVCLNILSMHIDLSKGKFTHCNAGYRALKDALM